MSRTLGLPPLARSALRGDRRALARLISEVENGRPEGREALRALYPRATGARIIGIAGPLGVGKSSLINALLRPIRSTGRTVAVVAVDPSSPFSGGSVLGDRIRLDRAPDDDGVFVRSMASRGHSGGVARTTREVARVLDAVGFSFVLVETVGSGQVDVEIRDVATTSVVVLVPHLGDEVQTLKAGLFEIADVFCVNKADLPGADRARRDLSDLAALGSGDAGWKPPIIMASTVDPPQGIEDLWSAIEAHERYLDESGERLKGERRRLTQEILALARDQIERDLARDASLADVVEPVLRHEVDPESAARRWVRARRTTP